METKNAIIRNYADALVIGTNDIITCAANLNDSLDENKATIATLNVLVEAIRSHTVLLQQAIDKYN